jgi:hypothetical protein
MIGLFLSSLMQGEISMWRINKLNQLSRHLRLSAVGSIGGGDVFTVKLRGYPTVFLKFEKNRW